ncbi:MAG: hypothetical protein R2784_16820 [Saprospiraceae bacterium]
MFPVHENEAPVKKRKQLNPNGDSELALLMRDMFDDGMKMKEMIKNGEHPEVSVDFQKILTANATEPEKETASPEYKAFAQTYIQTMEAMKKPVRKTAGFASIVEELYDLS